MELAIVAQALLTIPASEAAVERTFSAQDSIHTKKRNRLHDLTVQSSMFIAFNHRPMNSLSVHDAGPNTVELSLDFLESDTESEESDDESIVEEESKNESDVEIHSDPVSIQRTYSEIRADTREFLERFIKGHSISSTTRWSDDMTNMLESAALNHNPGGCSTRDLKLQIKGILSAGLS